MIPAVGRVSRNSGWRRSVCQAGALCRTTGRRRWNARYRARERKRPRLTGGRGRARDVSSQSSSGFQRRSPPPSLSPSSRAEICMPISRHRRRDLVVDISVSLSLLLCLRDREVCVRLFSPKLLLPRLISLEASAFPSSLIRCQKSPLGYRHVESGDLISFMARDRTLSLERERERR